MVQGSKSNKQALGKAARKHRPKYTVLQIVNPRSGKPRGKGAHEVWGLYDSDGRELARGSFTVHSGAMSWTVTRSFEAAFETGLGEGWMDK